MTHDEHHSGASSAIRTPPLELPILSSVQLADAVSPLVLALDIGSGSTRCCLYDAFARPIAQHSLKLDHLFMERADGTAQIDPDQIVAEVSELITRVTSDLDRSSIAALTMDTFAASLLCVDGSGDALTPCFTYADSRSSTHLDRLRETLDEEAVHQRVGTRLHTSYHPPRMQWLREEFPDIWARTARFLSIGEYVYAKLAGVHGAATSTMSWAGILNRHTLALDEELLEVMGVTPEQFSPVVDPSEPIAAVNQTVAQRWPALAGAVWFPAIPDGYASNLGVGAHEPSTAALSAATSGAIRVVVPRSDQELPSGLWSYSLSREHSLIGGALNDVGRVMLWLERTLAPATPDELDAVMRAPAAPGTPLVLPFLTGERATGWASDARAIFTGVASASTHLDLWRGAAEGIAISYARVFEQLRRVNPSLRGLVASGGVMGHYGGFMTIVAHALGFPVRVVAAKRVTMRGSAVLALSVINPGHPVARIEAAALTRPDPAQHEYYTALHERFERVYEANIG